MREKDKLMIKQINLQDNLNNISLKNERNIGDSLDGTFKDVLQIWEDTKFINGTDY